MPGRSSTPARIAAVGLTNQRESLLLWDRATGDAVGPMISWQDRRTARRLRRPASRGTEPLVRALSGLPLDPMFSATKATWLLDAYDPDRRPPGAASSASARSTPGCSSGSAAAHVIEIGNASRTQLMNVRDARWDDELLDLFGVPLAVLPEIIASAGSSRRPAACARCPADVPVAAVIGDSHAALFAHGAWQPGQVKATYGTGSSVMGVTDRTDDRPDGLCLTVAWQDGDGPTLGGRGQHPRQRRHAGWLARTVGSTPGELAALAETASSDDVYLVPGVQRPRRAVVGRPGGRRDRRAHPGHRTPPTRPRRDRGVVFQVEDVVEAVEPARPARSTCCSPTAAPRPTRSSCNYRPTSVDAPSAGRSMPTCPRSASRISPGLTAGIWSRADLERLDRPRDVCAPRLDEGPRRRRIAHWHLAVRRARLRANDTTAVEDGGHPMALGGRS